MKSLGGGMCENDKLRADLAKEHGDFPACFSYSIHGLVEPFFSTRRGTGNHAPHPSVGWQARRASNPQPAVLETATLPIELLACRRKPPSACSTGLLGLPVQRAFAFG